MAYDNWFQKGITAMYERQGEPKGYKLIPLEDRRQGIEKKKVYCRSGGGCVYGSDTRMHEYPCVWESEGEESAALDYWNAHPKLEPVF